jgi:hypothetical protein
MLTAHFFGRSKAIMQKPGSDPSNAGQPVEVRRLCRVVVTATLLYLSSIVAAQPADSLPEQQTSGFIEGKAQACLSCHNAERMHAILDTPHGTTENPDSPYAQHECESCHGPGRQHATRLRLNETKVPMISYGPESATPLAKQSQTCLDNCHEKDMEKLKDMRKLKGLEWNGSVHGRVWVDADGNKKEVSCANCHKLHEKHVELQDRTYQAKVCYECHEKSEREHPRFEDKGIVFDRLTCWDCHDVHQLIYQEPDRPGD